MLFRAAPGAKTLSSPYPLKLEPEKKVSPRSPGSPPGAAQNGSVTRKTVIYPSWIVHPLLPAQESNSDRLSRLSSGSVVTTGHLHSGICETA